MDSKAGGLMDGSASDMRDVRLCACRTQTVLKKASPMYDGKTRSALRGGNHALRAPIIGYGAGTMHGREKARVGLHAGRERRAEGERIDLLHGLHCLDIVGGVKLNRKTLIFIKFGGINFPPSKKRDEVDGTEAG